MTCPDVDHRTGITSLHGINFVEKFATCFGSNPLALHRFSLARAQEASYARLLWFAMYLAAAYLCCDRTEHKLHQISCLAWPARSPWNMLHGRRSFVARRLLPCFSAWRCQHNVIGSVCVGAVRLGCWFSVEFVAYTRPVPTAAKFRRFFSFRANRCYSGGDGGLEKKCFNVEAFFSMFLLTARHGIRR